MFSALSLVICVLLFIVFHVLGMAIAKKVKYLAEWADVIAVLSGVVAVAVYLKLIPLS